MSTELLTDWVDVLESLLAGEELSTPTTTWVMAEMLAGGAPAANTAAFLVALRAKGETAGEVSGLVTGMMNAGVPLEVEGPVVDTCGTGGDRSHTVNISTMAAIVAAAAGARVAKHGNRAASSQSGSADMLEALGVAIDLPAAAAAEAGSQGSGQGQPHKGSGADGPGGKGSEAKGKGGSTRDVLAEGDDDSDRPDWAGGAKEENPHRGEGNPTPGIRKGDEFGDLWVYERNPITGEVLEFDAEGNACDAGEECFVHVIVCTDEACDTTEVFVLAAGGELPEGVSPMEVEFGRLNIGRAPTSVLDHAENGHVNRSGGLLEDITKTRVKKREIP